ncbi:putative GRAS family transcription factor [Hibiscus syriacus]|uniref:GRAS family transcription factor n=1 Tax=Hibiscus syriacus TaxID=106335 RepID=A0A6A3C2U9_HIBSY|nr:putative GRAS family transcription factor [Hibiscus syriacus]
MLSARIQIPLCKLANGHEVVSSTSVKLPYVEKLPPYTTWIFLDKASISVGIGTKLKPLAKASPLKLRNQRMADDQSVVGRRRIYYDQHGSEALICSESEEDSAEPEEEKHEFSEGEDLLLCENDVKLVGKIVSGSSAVFGFYCVRRFILEYGLGEEILMSVSQFLGVTSSEIQDRHGLLRDKYSDQNIKDSEYSVSEKGISLDKSLSAALDSFDNLFCCHCLSEKQPYWSEYEDDRKLCSDQYLKQDDRGEERPVGLEGINDSECAGEAQTLVISSRPMDNPESSGKRKASQEPLDDPLHCSDGSQDFATKNNKNEYGERGLETFTCPASASKTKDKTGNGGKDVTEVPDLKWSSSEWKPIERELYLKGVEIFGRNR